MPTFAHRPFAREAAPTRWVQTNLNRLDDAGLRVDGIWGRETDNALRRFQASHGTEPSGVLGRATLRAIEQAGGTVAPALTGTEGEVSPASERCRQDGKRFICGAHVAEERRAPRINADERRLAEVPERLRYYAKRKERLLPDTLDAYTRMYDALHREIPGLPAEMLKLVSAYRSFNQQKELFKIGLLAEFKNSPCDTVPPGRLAWLIDRTNDAAAKMAPDPTDVQRWPNIFFRIASANGIGFNCGVSGARQRISNRRIVIAPPTSNSHQAGCTIDVWLGHSNTKKNRERHMRMPAFKWMVANAKRFGFHPYVVEPWHWEFIAGTAELAAASGAQAGGIWGTLLDRARAAVTAQPSTGGESEVFDSLGSLGSTLVGAAFSSAEKLWLAAHARSTGIRDRGKLTDAVFYRRHPDRKGRGIDMNAPGGKALAAEWRSIADKVVDPVLAYLSQQQGAASPAPAQNAPASGASTALGSLPLFKNGRQIGRYRFTAEDLEWLAKMVVWESGGGTKPEDRAVVQCVINRYAVTFHRRFKSFAAFLRVFSTTLQPVLINPGAAQRHYKTPEFERTGGYYEKAPTIPKGQLKRHLEVQRKAWADLPANARAVATQALTGQLIDPGIGNADNFASTTIYYKQKYGRKPDLAEWRAFTEAIGRSKGRWIGDVPGLDQTKNAFFLSEDAMKIPSGAIKLNP